MKIKFITIENKYSSIFISTYPAPMIIRSYKPKNDIFTLSILLLLGVLFNFCYAQTPIPQPKLSTATEPGRRSAIDIERQVEVIKNSSQIIVEESKDNNNRPITPPGAAAINIQGFNGLKLIGGTVYTEDQLSNFSNKFIGSDVSLAQIFQMARDIQTQYRKDGYLLTRVVVPEQKPQADGKIKLQIIEGYIERIRVEGDADEFKQRIESYLEKITGLIPVNNQDIERYLLLINDLPGISAKAVVRPAKTKLGATELLVRVEVDRFDGFALINNRGSKFRGPFRAMLVGTANSLLSLEEELKLVLLTAFEDDEQRYGSLSYTQPLGPEGLTVNLSASYGPSKPGSSLERFDIDSLSYYFSGGINYPLIRSRQTNLNLEFGFEAINSDTDVLGEPSIRDRLRVLHATAFFDMLDSWDGHSQMSFSVRQGLPALGASSNGSDKLSRFEGKSNFTSIQASASRLQSIFSKTSLLIATKAQYAFDTLLSDEEFYLGGEQFGRGYDVSELTGEHGVAVTAEIQHNMVTPFEIMPKYQLYGFYEYGVTWNNDTGVDPRQSLASAGAGFRLMIFDHFSIGFEVAKPLTRVVASENNKDPRLFFHISGHF